MSNESETKPQLHTYVVWAPDCKDPGALERRYSVREQHLAGVAPYLNKSILIGGMFAEPGSEHETGRRKAVGSLLIVKAETREKVEEMIKSDIYYTSGTWDPEKLVILPFFNVTNLL
ncbi:hypothetical protein CC1G_02052 [Coprinopsis cinerea okayama7|uniref:YCII-related domain-containing protein n=1 Tax=Coprinopsis cinerea (strain Okayama-7 / 130 / ATCC MYA-4618 / FGSC 9003) TaxID=240176 RepID=A8N6E8_COPC7|nr:hypothetical protein CC1G_02052 [Coprinopsis cinerea okayama7\|eukprot:XP_001830416.2 hypothetical protein CC1G_02052 [Coprinopsis cinerea okayama7\